jgi:hypothetical protein
MKRTLSAVAAAVLVSMMALMFLGGLLKKAARVVDGFGDPLTPPPPTRVPDDNTVHVRNGSGLSTLTKSGRVKINAALI